MPRIAGVNSLGVFLAALAMFFIGFIWYGMLFQATWMEANGLYWADQSSETIQWLTAEGVQTRAMAVEPLIMLGGFTLSLVLSYGLGWHMKQKNISTLKTAVLFGLWLSLLIGVPVAAYDFVYTPWHSVPGLLTDASYTVATFVAGCAVLSYFD